MTTPRSEFSAELFAHLNRFPTAPFLFVGSGFSKRYAGTPTWTELLTVLAQKTSKPYAQFFSSADGDLPTVATMIAEELHDLWWSAEEFAESRQRYPSPRTRASPLKIEVAQSLSSAVDALPEEGTLNDELEALRSAVVEGIITTNFDTILEYVFPDFVPYVGQDGLLFKDPRGVAEIYKIHGSVADPESLVITAQDFTLFRERNPYLAAKLLTIFVEHPVIFIGYSLTDDNVRDIVTSIAAILTNENLHQLEDRLIFVSWDPSVDKPRIAPSTFALDRVSIPIHLVTAPDFLEVFEVLGLLKRRFPARILRHLVDQIYELVRTSEPSGTVVVSDIESDTELSQVDVVIGVGISSRLKEKGLTGLARRDLLLDVLEPQLDPEQYATIVEEVLPTFVNARTHAPIHLYLRGAGLLDEEGALVEGARVSKGIRARVRVGLTPLRGSETGYFHKRAQRLLAQYPDLDALIAGASLSDALLVIPFLEPGEIDPQSLRVFLLEHVGLLDAGRLTDMTGWIKCVCFYDYVVNKLP
ncbi:SIR2 family protein [Agrococcus sp. Marseille-P2731]|uniref:SIR2 family protein n=1 Tax=Agrococcus sp. Marseille-P2731 TaxID=1841862 RepID=UPI001160103A|nr:SIR2 family protein [Agrococcus sp. Marseille-P2731]